MDRKEKRKEQNQIDNLEQKYDFYNDFKLNNDENVKVTSENKEDKKEVKEPKEEKTTINTPYQYQEKEYKTNSLEEHTVVTSASKFSRGILVGFYLMFIAIGVMVFFILRADRYEFYLEREEVTVSVGSTYQVELIPKNIRYFDYLNYDYKITDENIATVDEFGTITAVSNGTTTLKISLSPGFTSKTMKIITENLDVESLKLMSDLNGEVDKSTIINMKSAETIALKPVINNREDINTTVNYSSSDPSVATVDEFGYVTSKGNGTAIITGEKNGVVGTITINVKEDTSSPQQPKEITSISFASTNVNLKKDNTMQLSVVIAPKELSKSSLKFSSSNENIVTVDNNGNIKGIGEGTATITVTSPNGKKATCNVTVSNQTINVSSIKLNSTTGRINVGDVYQLNATIIPENATVRNLTWTSSNPSVATVNNGLVTGVSAGKAEITVKSADGKVSASCTVVVEKKVVATPTSNPNNQTKVTTVVITPSNTIIRYVGEAIQLSKKVAPANATISSVKWSSSDSSVASVDSNGILYAKKKGTAIITLEVDGVSATSTVIVRERPTPTTPTQAPQIPTAAPTQAPTTAPTVAPSAPSGKQPGNGVSLNKTSMTISKGGSDTFVISVSNAAGLITVSSSNTSVATVSSSSGDCNGSKCFFDSNSITFTVTGVNSGTASINISLTDVLTYDENPITGSGSVGVLVQ